MKQQARTKQHIVKYKGYTLIQTPWKSYEGKQYAKIILDPEGKERLHSGYGCYCSHKELKLIVKGYVERVLPLLERLMREVEKE